MCGIVGLHLRTPELYPRLGELLTGMLCEMGNRGSDSTGVAVYGDPIWSPAGRGGVSVVDVSDDAEAVATAVSERLGRDVDVATVDATYLLSADVELRGAARRGQGGISRAPSSRVSARTWPCSRGSGTRAR